MNICISGPVSPHVPFRALPLVTAEQLEKLKSAALSANDEYLVDFVEQHAFCPFAREGRRKGETSRHVHWASTTSLEPLVEIFQNVAGDESQSVVQVIFPHLEVEARAWIDFCAELTRYCHRARGGTDVMAIAALHPELEFSTENPFALVPLFRRSPDPTIQWVRLTSLDALYEGREKGSQFVDPSEILKVIDEPSQKPLYDRVAENNQAVARRMTTSVLVQTLNEIRQRARRQYAVILEEK